MGRGEEHGKYILHENKSIHKALKNKTRNLKQIKLQQFYKRRDLFYWCKAVVHRPPGNVVKLL